MSKASTLPRVPRGTPLRGGARAALAIAAGFAITACIIQQDPPYGSPGAPRTDAYGQPTGEGGLVDGDYACSLQSGGTQYPAFRCVVYTAEDGSRVLEKLGGSQRIIGRVQPTANGFRFDGEFRCPQGACDERTGGEFFAEGGQSFRGELPSKYGASTVVLTYLPGGFSYGGASYGGAGRGDAEQAPPSPGG
jgi:hypothetical protein